MSGMATQQEVIKAFMHSLDETTKSGADALDEAVVSCSGGKFSSMQDLIDCFISDVKKYGGSSSYDDKTKTFLKKYCGIILDNADTGSITGSDAGGSKDKTAESIVQESGSVSSFPSGGSTTINGLTFHWPDRTTLSSSESAVVDRIYSWWAKGALDLVQQSFGLNFQESGTTVKDISLEFYDNANDAALASVVNSYSVYTGKTEELTLRINMKYYKSFDQQNVNGKSNNTSAGYLDRTLAHEFVHAVMAANITRFNNLPLFVKEGLAELVHGIDDERSYSICALATTSKVDDLKKMFTIKGTQYNYGDASYAGGYMLFRYLAKQASTSNAEPVDEPVTEPVDEPVDEPVTGSVTGPAAEPDDEPVAEPVDEPVDEPVSTMTDGVYYNADKTAVTITAPFSGVWDARNYESTVRSVNASSVAEAVTIKAGGYNSTIWAGENGSNIYGQGGNDIIYGGNGKDVFWYGAGDGADTIYRFQSGTDVLHFYNKAALSSVASSGTNVILKSGSGSVKLVGKTNQRVDITDSAGKNSVYYFGRQDKANTFTYGANYRYYGSAKYKDTLQIKKGATVSLANTTLYNDIDILDARKAAGTVKLTGGKKSATLYGGKKNDILTAGSAGGYLRGGAGNDTIVCGKGTDKIQFYKGDGKDAVKSGAKNDILYLYNINNIKSQAKFKMSGKNLVMSFTNNKSDSITLTNWTTGGLNKFVVGNKTYSLKKSGGKVTVR